VFKDQKPKSEQVNRVNAVLSNGSYQVQLSHRLVLVPLQLNVVFFNYFPLSALPSAMGGIFFLYSYVISFFYTYRYDLVIDLTLINYFPPSTLIRPSLIIFSKHLFNPLNNYNVGIFLQHHILNVPLLTHVRASLTELQKQFLSWIQRSSAK